MTHTANSVEEGTELQLKFDAAGLITCVTVDAETRDVLMVAHMSEDALKQTLQTGIMTYWSRSRQALWVKGETSGATQKLQEMRIDCDQDALVCAVTVAVPEQTCHTGRTTCFYRRVELADGTAVLRPADTE